MITDVMFKSRIINPAVALFIMILINQKVCYNKTNPKLPPVIFVFQKNVMIKVTGQRSRW